MAAMEARSQAIRQQVAADEQANKETANTYARQVSNYQRRVVVLRLYIHGSGLARGGGESGAHGPGVPTTADP
jgi:flagellar basal body rod protein FlgC